MAGSLKSSGCGRSPTPQKQRDIANSAITETANLLRNGTGGLDGSNHFHQGSPFIDFLEQLVVQIVRNILDAPNEQIRHASNSQNVNQSRDVSNNEIIRPRDLPLVTGLSRTTIHRLRKENKFVPHIKLSCGTIGYSRKLIEEWLKDRQEV